MATKFYLHHTTTGLPSGTLPNTEQSTLTPNDNFEGSLTTNRLMNQTIGASQQQLTNASISSTSQQIYYVTRWVSPKLKVSSIDANTWILNFAASESDNRANFPVSGNSQPLRINVYVWRTSTGQKVGTILDGNTNSEYSEPAGTDERVKHGTFSGSAVGGISVDNDVIVFELWAVVTQAKSASYTQGVYYDGTTENTTPDALVSNHAGFLETPQNDLLGDLTPPTVQSTNPANGATGIPITNTIAITFSEAMDPATINTTNITVNDGGSNISGSWAMSGGNTIATFTPSSNLATNTTYTVTVSTNVKDAAGNAIASQYQFSFTTEAVAGPKYIKRAVSTGYTQTGGDSEALESCKICNTNTGADSNLTTLFSASVTERVKWISDLWKPNTNDWTGGDITWRYRVTAINANLSIVEVIVRRLSYDCQTVKASKSSGAISVSLGSTGVKSGTISWNDGTQNPVGRSANDRFEILFRITNAAGTVQSSDVGCNLSSNNDEISMPFDETEESDTTPTTIIETGTFQKPASTTGNQTVTLNNTSMRVKGLILMAVPVTANNGTLTEGCAPCIGFMDGSRMGLSVGMNSEDNVATTNTRSERRSAALVISGSAAIDSEADPIELGVGQFIINWVTNSASQYHIRYIAFGGSDINVTRVWSFVAPLVTGNFSPTGAGFQGNLHLFQSTKATSIDNATGSWGQWNLGFAKDSANRGAVGVHSNDNVTTSNTKVWQRTDHCILQLGLSGADDARADFVSHDADGITINITNEYGSAEIIYVFSIAYKGTLDVGAFNVSAGTGIQTVNLTEGKTPKCAILLSTGVATTTSITDGFRLSVGCAESTSRRNVVSASDDDNISPTETVQLIDTSKILELVSAHATAASSTVELAADLSSFASGNFAINKSTNTGTLGTFEVLYIAFSISAEVTRISKQVSLVWNNNERVSKSNNIRWNNAQRISKQATILWHNSIRISKLVSIVWNNSERISKVIDIRWKNTQQISKLTPLVWINHVIISKQNSIIWNNHITISKVIDLRWNNFTRIGKLIDLRWNNLARVSKTISIVWDNLTRISKENSIVWNNNERLSKLTSLVWNNNNRISKLIDLRWNNNTRISKQASLVWNNFAHISKVVSLVWNNSERISKTVSLLWNNDSRISKAITLQWHNIARISKSVSLVWHNYNRIEKQVSLIWTNIARIEKTATIIWNNASGGLERLEKQITLIWNNTARVSKSSDIRWNNYDRISKQVSLVWHNIARLSKATTLQWNNNAQISKSISLVWNNIQRISKVCNIQWNNQVTISKPVTIQWNNNARISKSVSIIWNNLSRVSRAVSLLWNNSARISKQVSLVWINNIRISKSVDLRWNNQSRVSKTVILIWINYQRISKQNTLIWNNFISGVNRLSKQITLIWNNQARVSKTTTLRWNNFARISKYVRLLWNNLAPEYREKYPHLKGRNKSVRDYMRKSNMPNWSNWLYKTR